MKILAVSHMFPNNQQPCYGVFVKERLKHIAKYVDLTIVAPVPYFPLSSLVKKYHGTDKIAFKEQNDKLTVWHPRFFIIPKYFKWLDGYTYFYFLKNFFKRKIMKSNADILDFHWVYPDAFAGIRWAKKYGKKIIITVRGNESICYFENSLRKKMLIKTLRKADHVISVSNDLKQKIVNEYGVLEHNVTTVGNGIDKEKFYFINKEKAKKQCGLTKKGKYIISLCRLSHEKGLNYLLEAFSRLTEENVFLIIVGDGPLRDELRIMADKLEIADKVKFVGEIKHEDARKWYNAADIYCLPSLWEGCPNTIIESIACGTPVVSTNVGGIPDLVNNDSGVLVPAGNVEALRNALVEALSKKWDYEKISAIGQSNSWDNVADKVIDVYKKVLSSD